MTYTIGETAKRLGVAPSTLRYYDREGLLPFAKRTDSGIRQFCEADFEWLRVICCLKKTGMKLNDIKAFVEMAMLGDETIDRRLSLITEQSSAVRSQIAELSEALLMLEYKEWYYRTAAEHGTAAVPRNMPSEQIPERFREIRRKLGGK